MVSVRYRGTDVANRVAKLSGATWLLALALYLAVSLTINSVTLGSVHPLYGVIAMLILLPAVVPTGGSVARILSNRVLLWFGVVSYAFYLWHQLVIQQTAHHILHIHSQLALLLVSAAITAIIAAASYYLIERPWLRRKQRVAPDGTIAPVDRRSLRRRDHVRVAGRPQGQPAADQD